MKKIFYFLLIIIISIPLFSYIRFLSLPYIGVNGFTQGTSYSVKVLNKFSWNEIFLKEHQQLFNLIEKSLVKFDSSLNSYVPYSIISRINDNQPDVELDNLFVSCFNASKLVFDETDGTFDITGGPLYSAWGFGPGEKKDLSESMLDSLLEFVGMDKVRIEQNRLIKENPNVILNVNAIAQGYSVDFISDILLANNYTSFIVEIGGEIKAKGEKRKGKKWIVGIDKPTENNFTPGADLELMLQLNDRALATSGNYRKFIEENGKKYSHSINPKTGYPVKHSLLSATIIADKCMMADAYATAFMVNGMEWAQNFLSFHKELEAVLIYADSTGNFSEFRTEGIKQLIYSAENK